MTRMVSIDETNQKIFYFLVNKNPKRSKVDPSGFQSSLIDSSGPVGVWQGSHPPPHPSLHYPGRLPFMSPREFHFPPQHMRQFRPSLPPPTSPEYRLYDLNKRLSMRTEECDQLWWDAFVNEFFEEDATLIISMHSEDGPKRFHVIRVLIPRFFRTLFDGGVSEVYFLFKQTKESFHHPTISIDCEQGSLVTCFGKPSFIKVCTEGHFNIEFTFDDLMRIKSWHFNIKQHRELIPRSVVAIPTDNPTYLDQLSKNFTRNGLTSSMLNFLRLCEILEPMQELMSRHKTTSFSPRDCLKTILHQRWSKTCSDTRPAPKTRRKRKAAAGTNNLPATKDSTINNSPTPTKKRAPGNNIYVQPPPPPPPGISSLPGDVMIVGEPSLMGGEMDDEDERYISRLENSQYDPNVASSQYPSLLHPKPPLISNSNPMKREQISIPNSPQQLPSMFTNNSPTPNGSNLLSSTPADGELSATIKKVATNSPQTPSANQNSSTPAPTTPTWNGSTTNSTVVEKKQEPHTPPVTPQQTIATAS